PAGVAHPRVVLGAALRDRLLDASGVNAAVADQLREGHARHLAAHWVEPGQDDRLGCVVDDQIDPGGLLERPNVAPLAADDAALHLLAGERDDGDRHLTGVVGSDPLHDGGQDAPRALVALLGGLPLDGANLVVGFGARLVDGLADEPLACLPDRASTAAHAAGQPPAQHTGRAGRPSL